MARPNTGGRIDRSRMTRAGSRGLLSVALALVSCVEAENPAAKAPDLVLQGAVARTPEMQPADLYKLLHQGWLGPGHAAPAREGARRYLEEERSRLSPVSVPEPVLEPLPGPHDLVRVHLRAWPAERDDALASAFVFTAETIVPDREGLVRELHRVGLDLQRLRLPFDEVAWRAFVDARVAEGLPAVHHSDRYRVLYAPAYRVVQRSLAEKTLVP
jgi:hypothetical protein